MSTTSETQGSFVGRTALVTGATGAIGSAVTMRLVRAGAQVVLVDVDSEKLSDLAAEIERLGGVCRALTADVSAPDQVGEVVSCGTRDLGVISLGVTCAGVIRLDDPLSLGYDEWSRTMAINLGGTFLVFQALASAMLSNGVGGSLVALSSISGRQGRPDCVDYAASKAAVISVAQSLSLRLAPSIRVNAVCPGIVDTTMTTGIHLDRGERAGIAPEESLRRSVSAIPLQRIATADDVAAAVMYLSSDEAGYVTGQALNVCGGLAFD